LAEDRADIHLDPVLYRACAVDLKGACKDVPRGNGRRKMVTLYVGLHEILRVVCETYRSAYRYRYFTDILAA